MLSKKRVCTGLAAIVIALSLAIGLPPGLDKPSLMEAASGDVSLDGWTVQDSPAGGKWLYGVWGSSSNDVFAVGDGIILHYDGNTWRVSAQNIGKMRAVWGTSSTDVYAVGDNGAVAHYDGTTWNRISCPSEYDLRGVWADSPNNILAVGSECYGWFMYDCAEYYGVVLHYDGSKWTTVKRSRNHSLNALWANSGNDIFAVGTMVLHYDGSMWTSTSAPTWDGMTIDLEGVWGVSDSCVFAVGNEGVVDYYRGTTWSYAKSAVSEPCWGVWASTPSDAFAVGNSGAIFYYDGKSWSHQDSGTDVYLEGVWGSSTSDVFAVGEDGVILHRAEQPCQEVQSPPILLVHGFLRADGWTLNEYWAGMVDNLTGKNVGRTADFTLAYDESRASDANYAMKCLEGNGHVVYISNYTHAESRATDHDIREYAQSLAREIEIVTKRERACQVDIVAHSMGGLVTRAYIESGDLSAGNSWPITYKGNVRKLIMLGTPNSGTSLASNLICTSCQQLEPDSAFLSELIAPNSETGLSKNVEYSAVAGNFFECRCNDIYCQVTPSLGSCFGNPEMWFGAMLQCSPENVGRNDGGVPVNSVQLGEIASSRWFMLPFSHSALAKHSGDLVEDILAAPCFTNETIDVPASCQARLCSPGELRVYDSNGKVTGLVDGATTEEILGSAFDTAENCVVVFPADDTYRYEVVGNTEGTYGLILTHGEGEEVTHFVATDIPLASGSVHEYTVDWDALSARGNGASVHIDVNGDGKFDKKVTADGELTADEFALAKSTGRGMPYWVWIVVGVAGATAVAIAALMTRHLVRRGSGGG